MKLRTSLLSLLTLSLLTTTRAASTDTIAVESAKLIGPYAMAKPYLTTEKNLKQAAFSSDDYLRENRALIFRENTDGEVRRDDALAAVDSTETLRVLRFTLRTSRFVTPKLNVRCQRNYKLYVEGEEQYAGRALNLQPGEVTVNMLCLTKPQDRDTFRVDIIGEDLAGLEVNAATPRLYMQRDMLLGPHYGSPQLSPTGKYYSYTINTTKADGSNLYETFLKETKTDRLLAHYNEYKNLTWFPRQDLLYTTKQDARGRILLTIDPETQEQKELAVGIPEGQFTLSPSGEFLIYSRNDDGPQEVNGTKRIIDPDDRMPGWRTRTALYRYDIASARYERLTFGEKSVYLQDISADGHRLLLSFSEQKPSRTPFLTTTVVEMDAKTLAVDTLLSDEPFIGSASYSPDASQLLVKASPNAFGGIGSELREGQIANSFDYRLYLFDRQTRKVTPLLRDFLPSVDNVTWAAGDGCIYFSAEDGYDKSLFRLDPVKGRVAKIETPLTYVTRHSISSEEKHPRALIVGQSALRARSMYLLTSLDGKTRAEERGEISFDDLTRDLRLPTSAPWTFRASRGDTIKGFYYLPADFDATKKYPMIVYYYGGCTPTGRYLESYYPHASFANTGYVVLVLEPSGAIGFGQEFAARHVNTWGDESSDDIIEGVKTFCAEHEFVNRDRIGCMGASYGGFMTQYLQTRTDIFACAISHAGISHITGYWGGGYWGYTYGETAEYGSFPWNNPDLFVKHSPLYNADKIHTPLLLLHGTVDTNVPTDQSQAMYTALRILDRPVAYVTIEGQDHHVTDWKKRMAWQQIINAWFALWLKDEPRWWNTLYPGDCFDKTKK